MQNVSFALPDQTLNVKALPFYVNKPLIQQIQDSGVEVEILKTESHKICIAKKNPIERLFEKEILTRDERRAALKYQKSFNLYFLGAYASPSLDDTTCASRQNQNNKKDQEDSRHEARQDVDKIKALVLKACTSRQVSGFKKSSGKRKIFSREKKYDKILLFIFEYGFKISFVEALINSDRRTIEDDTKYIAKIMLDYYSRKNNTKHDNEKSV